MTAVVALFVALAAALCLPGRSIQGQGQIGGRRPLSADTLADVVLRRVSLGLVVGAGAGVGAAIALGLPVKDVYLLLLGVVAAKGIVGLMHSSRQAHRRRQQSAAVLLACESLAADLWAGRPPLLALEQVTRRWPVFAAVSQAAAMGADVPEALRVLGATPGASQLRVLAAAWQVADRAGAGLADALEEIVAQVRADEASSRVIQGELASARATARMMAVLPIAVLGFGVALGSDPFAFLLHTPVGLGVLTVGGALVWVGLRWIDAIVARAEVA